MKPFFVVIGVLAVLAVCVCGGLGVVSIGGLAAVAGSSTPTTSRAISTAAPAQVFNIGQSVQAGEWNVTITGVDRPGKSLVWSEFGNKTDAKGSWLIVNIDLQHKGQRNFTMNTSDWELLDSDGVKYDASTDAFSYASFKKLARFGDQIPPNTPVKSALVYDVATSSKGFRLTLKATKTTFSLGL